MARAALPKSGWFEPARTPPRLLCSGRLGRRRLCASEAAQERSEFDLLCHLLAVLVAKVPINLHGESAAAITARLMRRDPQ